MKRHDPEYSCSFLPQYPRVINPIDIEAPKSRTKWRHPNYLCKTQFRTPQVPNPVVDGNPGTTILSSSLWILKNSPKVVRYTRNNVPYDITQFERTC